MGKMDRSTGGGFTPMADLVAEEAARVCPEVDVALWIRQGRQALELAQDRTIDAPRRELFRQIAFATAEFVGRLAVAAAARRQRHAMAEQGQGHA